METKYIPEFNVKYTGSIGIKIICIVATAEHNSVPETKTITGFTVFSVTSGIVRSATELLSGSVA